MSKDDKQVTWGGRFLEQPDALMQVFGESVSFDKRFGSYDLNGSLAHAKMLCSVGLLSDTNTRKSKKKESMNCSMKLKKFFAWKLELEDAHMNLNGALLSKTKAAEKVAYR